MANVKNRLDKLEGRVIGQDEQPYKNYTEEQLQRSLELMEIAIIKTIEANKDHDH